jgi:hypothetical protein
MFNSKQAIDKEVEVIGVSFAFCDVSWVKKIHNVLPGRLLLYNTIKALKA